MTITDIITEHGAVYKEGGQGVKDIIKKLMAGSETMALFPSRMTNQTVMEKAFAEISRVLQRFQKGWTPISSVTFTPVKIPLYKIKIDVQETPDDLEESWLGFLAGDGIDRKEWPFIKWWLNMVLERAIEDMEKNEVYAGVPGAITPGTATAAGASLMGIKKVINTGITDTDITPITMGAIPTDPVDCVLYFEDFYANIDPLLRAELDYIICAPEVQERYQDGMIMKYNMNYAMVNDLNKVKRSTIKLKGVLSHTGQDKIWTTPSWNRQRGLKRSGNASIFKVENVDRTVKAYTDHSEGIGFWILQYLITNDQNTA